jgi:hypothetical protein
VIRRARTVEQLVDGLLLPIDDVPIEFSRISGRKREPSLMFAEAEDKHRKRLMDATVAGLVSLGDRRQPAPWPAIIYPSSKSS